MRARQKDNNETNAKERKEKKKRESCHHYELDGRERVECVYVMSNSSRMSNRVERTTTELAKRRSIHPDVRERRKKKKATRISRQKLDRLLKRQNGRKTNKSAMNQNNTSQNNKNKMKSQIKKIIVLQRSYLTAKSTAPQISYLFFLSKDIGERDIELERGSAGGSEKTRKSSVFDQ